MKGFYRVLAGSVLATLVAAGAYAQGKNVQWRDDGTVDLIMDDGTTINTSQ